MIDAKEQKPQVGKDVLVKTAEGFAVACYVGVVDGYEEWCVGPAVESDDDLVRLTSNPTHWAELPEV